MSEKEVKDKLKKGWVHVLVTFEIIGKPKEHVDKTLEEFLANLKKVERIHWIESHSEPAIDAKDGFFSAYAEVDMLVQNLETLNALAIDYTPASIEIIEPGHFEFQAADLQAWINDLLTTLHDVSIKYKATVQENQFLRNNLSTLLTNNVLLSIGRGNKTLSALSKDTSITTDALKQHLDKLVKAKKVVEKKGSYSLA